MQTLSVGTAGLSAGTATLVQERPPFGAGRVSFFIRNMMNEKKEVLSVSIGGGAGGRESSEEVRWNMLGRQIVD